MTVNTDMNSRFSRQESILPPSKLAQERIILIGAGAVGRQVGIQLAAGGAMHVQVVDFDLVEMVNVATQGYSFGDVGKLKAEVLAETMRGLSPEGGSFTTRCDMWSPANAKLYEPTILFSCVDNMEARASIYKFFQKTDSVKLLVDGRMLGETIRFITVQRGDSHYEGTLFTDRQAAQGRCTSQSTYYASSILASLLIRQLSMHLREYRLDIRDKDRKVNLLDLDCGFSA